MISHNVLKDHYGPATNPIIPHKEKGYWDLKIQTLCQFECNSEQMHTLRLFEQRVRLHTKRSIFRICDKCENAAQAKEGAEEFWIAMMMAHIRISEAGELMEAATTSSFDYDSPLLKFNDAKKFVEDMRKSDECHYSSIVPIHNQLKNAVTCGLAICYLEIGEKSKLGKLQKLHFDKAKKYIEYLMLGAERFKDIDAQRRLSWLESNYERFPDFVKFINDKTSKENAEIMQRHDDENSKITDEDIKKIKEAQLKKAQDQHNHGTMPSGWK